jgi:hypothetical protein
MSRGRVKEIGFDMAVHAEWAKMNGPYEFSNYLENVAASHVYLAKCMEDQNIPFIEQEAMEKALRHEMQSPSELSGASKVKPNLEESRRKKAKWKLFSWIWRDE